MRRFFAGTALFLITMAAPAAGQQSRSDLIDAALSTSDAAQRLDLLVRALDPALGAPDSTWAIGAFSIAFGLTQAGQEDEAGHWLRWAVREGASLGLEPGDFPALFPPPLVAAYGRARAQVEAQGSPSDGLVTSDWSWPASYTAGAEGAVVVRVEGVDGIDAEIEGVGPVSDGATVPLAAGTYRVILAGEGVSPVSVRREVLPGVVRTLTIAASAELFPGAQARAEGSLVRLRRDAGGAEVCTSGVLATGNDGLVVIPLSALDGTGVELIAPDGRLFSSLEVPVRDTDLGVGVARLGGVGLTAFESAEDVDGPSWVVFHEGCGPVGTARVTWGQPNDDGVGSLQGAPGTALGGAVIDQQGRLLALGMGTSAISAERIAELVERARRTAPIVAGVGGIQPEAQDSGGGFPVKWVLAGAAAAGVAAALLAGGGGGDGDDGGGGGGGRTGIVINWPGG